MPYNKIRDLETKVKTHEDFGKQYRHAIEVLRNEVAEKDARIKLLEDTLIKAHSLWEKAQASK